MRVELPGGKVVQAHGLSGFISVDRDEPPDWALYLDEQWQERSIDWPCRFVDWPDFGLPVDEGDAFAAFAEAWQRAQRGELVDIACDGGTGRTGTALACIAVLAGIPPADVVGWVCSLYHPWAVEVAELQEPLIARFAQGRRPPRRCPENATGAGMRALAVTALNPRPPYGCRARTTSDTSRAPACRKVSATTCVVSPEVNTSSNSSSDRPATWECAASRASATWPTILTALAGSSCPSRAITALRSWPAT